MDRLQAMACFVRVVEAGSFSAAARQLRLGQPAVSKMVAQLEHWLGTPLLLRSTRRLVPTEAGQEFHAAAKRALEAAEEAEQVARGRADTLRGRLRVCAATTFSRLHIVPRLGPFLERHPALELDLVLDDRQIDLIEAGFDLALRMGTLSDSSLTARKLGESPRMVVAAPDFIVRHGIPDHPSVLERMPAVTPLRPGGGHIWTFQRPGETVTVTLGGRFQVSAAEGLRAAALAGHGFVVGSAWLFGDLLAQGKLQGLLPDWHLPAVPLWAVTPAGRHINARARAFIDFVAALGL